MRNIEPGESLGEMFQRTTHKMDVVGMEKIGSECRRGGKHFEIMGESLASTAATFAMLKAVEDGFQIIVGACHQANSSGDRLGKCDDVAPKMGAVTIHMRENQVDGLTPVFGGAPLGALPAQGSGEAFER